MNEATNGKWGDKMERNDSGKSEQTKRFKQRLYSFTLKLIEFIDKLPSDNVSRIIGDQLLRSGTSIIGNHIEGLSASSKRDLRNYFNHSLKSANESMLWLSVLRDSGRTTEQNIPWLLDELKQYSKIFSSSILTLKEKR
jgi:four helix bundle protein